MNNIEIKRELSDGGLLMLQKNGDIFKLTANFGGHNQEGDLSSQGAVEALSGMIRAFITLNTPRADYLGEETTGFMMDAVNQFPELAERYNLMTNDEPGAVQ